MFENKKKEKQQKVTKWMLNGKDMLIYLIVGFMTHLCYRCYHIKTESMFPETI